jgi:DNA-binding NarL/FixJ family response regulator
MQPGREQTQQGAGRHRVLRVLIAEDEMFVAMDAEAIITRAGHQVVGIAPSADDAIAKTAQLKPDLILMDIRLKGHRDGIDAAEEIRSRFGLPVLFVSANVDPVTHARAMKVAPMGFISKPVSSDSLIEVLESLCAS